MAKETQIVEKVLEKTLKKIEERHKGFDRAFKLKVPRTICPDDIKLAITLAIEDVLEEIEKKMLLRPHDFDGQEQKYRVIYSDIWQSLKKKLGKGGKG